MNCDWCGLSDISVISKEKEMVVTLEGSVWRNVLLCESCHYRYIERASFVINGQQLFGRQKAFEFLRTEDGQRLYQQLLVSELTGYV